MFLTVLFRKLQRNNYDQTEFLESIERVIGYFFTGNSPGYGLDSGECITGYFDDEWMKESDIDKFVTGEAFVVDITDYEDAVYPIVKYSKEEFSGWIAFSFTCLFEENQELTKGLLSIGEKFFLYDKSMELVHLAADSECTTYH